MWQSSRVLVLALTSFLGLSAVSAGPSFRGGHGDVARRLASASSLRLHFAIKRDSMYINGASEFDVFANPVLSENNSIAFNGQATFVDGTTVQKYLLVDGVTYSVAQSSPYGVVSETVSCLPATVTTPLQELVGAINTATPVVNVLAVDEQVSCEVGSAYKITFGGETYALCAAKQASGAGFKIIGSDLDIERSICRNTTSAASAASANSTRSLAQNAEEATVTISASSCACKGKMRPCIFIHGLGLTDNSGLSDTTTYFGDIAKHAPCCSSVKFAHLNTVDYPWTSATQQQKVCDMAISMSSTSSASTKTIDNTIIVAHSMGNLLLGGAIANGKCKLSSTSSWVALSGPMKGSMGSDYLQNACSGNSNGFVEAVANLIGRCPANPATVSLAYQGEAYASSALNAAYAAAQTAFQTYVSAAMCSNSFNGLISLDQPVYALGGTVINHKSKENDGIVEYLSCAGGLSPSKFSNMYTGPFYVTKLNHMDTTFRHGDAVIDNAKKPVKWFECLL
uniref:DUF676 domain-containing protein n=1 Tax=Globisporangium ultimum (strain ATCC 200006 / CBS 805.95 / DAOM BR144) TaxID=431595 RepID=K3WM65_GLOUD